MKFVLSSHTCTYPPTATYSI